MSCKQVTVCEAINIAKGYVVVEMNCEFIALQREIIFSLFFRLWSSDKTGAVVG